MKVLLLKDRILKSNFLLSLLSIFIGLTLNLFIWDTLKLPFNNPDDVVGKLSIYSFNPSNNIIRFLLFISIPSLIFLFFSRFQKINTPVVQNELKSNKFIVFLLFGLIFFNILSFVSQDFNTDNFDYFHEGLEMLPALNYEIQGGIWSSTLFVRGAFVDLFTAKVGWEIFNTSIGSYRYIVSINNLLVELAFIFLIFSIWVNIRKWNFGYFFPVLASSLYFFTPSIQNLDRRHLIFIIGLSIIFLSLRYSHKILYFLIGILSAISIFFSLDTGIFYNATVFLFIILSFKFNVDLKNLLKFSFLGFITGWSGFVYFVGLYEFKSFIENALFLFKYKDLLDSYIYPNPFLASNYRFSFPLILIMLNLLNLSFLYKSQYFSDKKNLFFLNIIFTFATIFQFRSGLGRSDFTHIEYSSTLILILFIYNFSILMSFYKFFQTNYYMLTNILILTFLLYLGFQSFLIFKYDNLKNYSKNLENYINYNDQEFTKNEKFGDLSELRDIFKNEKCIFSFGNDAITPYLLRKSSCSKYYLVYFASPAEYQDKVINQMREISPEFIIYSTNSWYQNIDNIPNQVRINKISNYIQRNYKYYITVSNNWVIYKKVN